MGQFISYTFGVSDREARENGVGNHRKTEGLGTSLAVLWLTGLLRWC